MQKKKVKGNFVVVHMDYFKISVYKKTPVNYIVDRFLLNFELNGFGY